MPGDGTAASGRAGSRGSPHGTQRTRSAGVRPPCGTAVTTAGWPSIPWTRASTRSARSVAAASPPQIPSCRPAAGATSSGTSRSRINPAVARSSTAIASSRAVSQPSSCQRTRARQRGGRERAFVPPAPCEALAVLGLGLDHHPGAREPERRQARQEPLGDGPGRERGRLDLHDRWVELHLLDEVGRGRRRRRDPFVEPGREPVRRAPSGPKRPRTAAGGSSANAPSVRSPSRASRSARSSSSSTVTGQGARNAGDAPAGDHDGPCPVPPPAPPAAPRTCRRRRRGARRRCRARAPRPARPRRRRRPRRSSATVHASGTRVARARRARSAA